MRTHRRLVVRRRLLPRRLRYHPATRWVAGVIVIMIAFAVTQHSASSVAHARQRWGDTRTVAVARHRILVGSTIDGASMETQSWPAALVPEGALESGFEGRTAIATIEAGEAVLRARVAPEGLEGIAALVPDGWRALAVPVAPTVIALRVGDRVDLIAGFDVGGTTTDRSPSLTVARDALVVAVDEKRVTVAVSRDDAERVAFAIVAGTVVPALRAIG